MHPQWLDVVLGIATDASVRIAIAAALVAVILAALRIHSSDVRHRVWTGVLVAMLAMPVLPSMLPALEVPMPALPSLTPAAWVVIPPAASESAPRSTVAAQPVNERPAAPATTNVRPPELAAIRSASGPSWPWVVWSLYLVVATAMLVRLVIGLVAMRRISRSSLPVTAVEWFESRLVAVPMTVGIAAPRVVLPLDWRTWAGDKLAAVLAHERAHVARRDPLVGLVARVNRCVFWFHPLAWWLERELTATAEHACDDAALRAIGNRRRYAEVLIDTALIVRRHGGRLMWHGIGVDGGGLLGARIDRVLQGREAAVTSVVVRLVLATGCAGVIFAVAACQQPFEMPPPLEEDQAVVRQVADERAHQSDYSAVAAMIPADVAGLEEAIRQTPENFNARRRLLLFYRQRGDQVLGNQATEARRRHVLWLIEHHPEHELTRSYQNLLSSPRGDPDGFEAARSLWLERTGNPGVTRGELQTAAVFFRKADPRLAEQLLIRAAGMDSGAQQASGMLAARLRSPRAELGSLYAELLSDPETDTETISRIRRTLESSNDAELLAVAGRSLKTWPARRNSRIDQTAVGQSYLDRAATLDPKSVVDRTILLAAPPATTRDGQPVIRRFRDGRSNEVPLSELSDVERLAALPLLAERAYLLGEALEHGRHDPKDVSAAWDRARRHADDALALTRKLVATPLHEVATYQAHLVLSILALRAGDRQDAVDHLLLAAGVQPSDRLATSHSAVEDRLVAYLLKYGERGSIVEFLERTAKLKTVDRDARLKAIEALRQNRMPAQYQRVLSHDQGGKN